MEFPLHITFKLMSWSAHVRLTDGAGKLVGHMPSLRRGLLNVPIYADESMGTPIYTIKAEHMFTHWFEDAAGRRIGEFGITAAGGMGGGKFAFVGAEPRFHFVQDSEWLDFMDRMVPSLPVLNGLTGLVVRPRTHAVCAKRGTTVLTMVKRRGMIDIRYSLYALEDLAGPDQECLMLSSVIYALFDHNIKMMS